VLAQCNRRTFCAEAFDEIDGVEDAFVFAATADCDERHLGIDELAKCPAYPSFAGVSIARCMIAIALFLVTSADPSDP
jgi:hypothetical protein